MQRILSNLKSSRKALLASAILVVVLAGNVMPAFAQATPDPYAVYKTLFNNPTSSNPNIASGNTNEFTKKAWVPDADKNSKKLSGMWLKFKFDFANGASNNQDNAKITWDHIAAPSGNHIEFFVRSCDIKDDNTTDLNNCLYAKVPYAEDITSINSSWVEQASVWFGTSWLSYLSGPTGVVLGTVATDAKKVANSVTKVIYRKGDLSTDNYTNRTSNDILALQWFDIGGYMDNKPTTVDWLSKPAQRVSIWYQGAQNNRFPENGPRDIDPKGAVPNNIDVIGIPRTDIRYFKISEVDFPKPTSYEDAAATYATTALEDPNSRTTERSNLPGCSFLNGALGGQGSFMGCIAQGVYYVIYVPISWFAGLMGNLFDFFLGYSLDDASYRADFAVRGWKIVRDISNIFFILILVWTGLETVFKNSSANIKSVVPNLILNALLINFSLFGVRVLIDISNIVARVFYNTIQVCDGPCNADKSNIKADGIGGYTPLSEAIVSSFNPQKLFDTRILTDISMNPAMGSNAAGTVQEVKADARDKNDYATYFIVVSLIGALILFAVAMMFWKTAFMFLGRVIGLYLSMIFAPFAILGREKMPIVGDIKMLSWSDWSKDLIKYVLLAPVFVLFLYIIYSFIQSGFMKIVLNKDTSGNFFETVIYISVPMLIVYFMIGQGVKIAEKYAGMMGEMIQNKIVGGVVGATVAGIASGGLASVARGTLGRAGSALAKSETLRRWSGGNTWLGRKVGDVGIKLGEKGSNASFDIRNTGALKELGITGKEYSPITKLTRTTTDNTKGGVVGSIDRKEKRGYERMKTFQITGDMAVDRDKKTKKWEDDNIKTDLDNWKLANPALANDSFSVEQEKQRLIGIASIPGNKRPESSKEINLKRNKDYGTRMKRGNLASRIGGNIASALGTTTGTVGAIAGSTLTAGIGAGAAAVGGEFATGGIADTRVQGNVGKLAAHEAEIARLTTLIAPLQNWLLTGIAGPGTVPTGTPLPIGLITKPKIAELNGLKAKLKAEETKRDALNEKLTKKD